MPNTFNAFPTAFQSELEMVLDKDLRRIRNQMIQSKFDRFDVVTSKFIPSAVLIYEYPCDQDIVESSTDHGFSNELFEISVEKMFKRQKLFSKE